MWKQIKGLLSLNKDDLWIALGMACGPFFLVHLVTNLVMVGIHPRETIMIGGMVPWSIACTVPLGFMGADPSAVPYAFFFWLVPICYALTKKKFDFSK